MTEGAEINFGGAREVYSSVDQTKKVKTKKKGLQSKEFYEIRCESTKITKKQFLLANSRAVNTNLGVLGLALHSSSPESVNFFGAQSSLGGHNFRLGGTSSHLGGTSPECPPVAPGLREGNTNYSSFTFLFCVPLYARPKNKSFCNN